MLAERTAVAPGCGPHGAPRVALLGNPWGFTEMGRRLHDVGADCRVYFFPDVSGSRVPAWLRRGGAASRITALIRGYTSRYTTLAESPSAAPVTAELRAAGAPDLAIHHLPFIIRRPLIDAFPRGILNDHLGVLPYVRGRSSIEYSLLFGFPVGGTVHVVAEGVDTGPLIGGGFVAIDGRRERTVAAVRARVTAGHEERLAHAVCALGRGLLPIDNPVDRGLQHFAMHALLVEHVERHVLPARKGDDWRRHNVD